MMRLELLGDKACVVLCWTGLLYILYSHLT